MVTANKLFSIALMLLAVLFMAGLSHAALENNLEGHTMERMAQGSFVRFSKGQKQQKAKAQKAKKAAKKAKKARKKRKRRKKRSKAPSQSPTEDN